MAAKALKYHGLLFLPDDENFVAQSDFCRIFSSGAGFEDQIEAEKRRSPERFQLPLVLRDSVKFYFCFEGQYDESSEVLKRASKSRDRTSI